jgi:hypothetical protein
VTLLDEPGTAARRTRRSRPLAIGTVTIVAVVVAAAYAILWLPLDERREADIRAALSGYETAGEIAWPAGEPLVLPLTDDQQEALAAHARARLSRFAAGAALAAYDGRAMARVFASVVERDMPWVVTKWRGEVVYYDFMRRTWRGEAIVRGGVLRSHQIGRMNEVWQRIRSRRWIEDGGADIFEYRLRSDEEGRWRVVAAHHWGVCDAEGGTVVEGRDRL